MSVNPLHGCRVAVDARRTWDATWEEVPYLYPVEATHTAAPTYGQGVFEYAFGGVGREIKRPDQSAFAPCPPTQLTNNFVRVRCRYDDSPAWVNVWYGVVADDRRDLQSSLTVVGDQQLVAQELAFLFDRTYLNRAVAREGNANQTLGWCPPFNERHLRGGESILGNRSNSQQDNGGRSSYVLERAGQVWNSFQILEYLWAWWFPSYFTVDFIGLHSYLQQAEDIHDFRGLSVWQALCRLINRREGYVFDLRVNPQTERLEIHVQTSTATAITMGAKTLPANSEQGPYTLPASFVEVHATDKIPFRLNVMDQYDRLVIEGQRIKVAFSETYDQNGQGGNLQEVWETSLESEYRAALGVAESPAHNDNFRNRDAYRGMFCAHRLRPDWDWMTRSAVPSGQQYPVAVKAKDDGTVDASTRGPYWNESHLFERLTPFQQGTNYYTNNPVIPEREAPPRWVADRPFVPIMVWVNDAVNARNRQRTDRWYFVDRKPEQLGAGGQLLEAVPVRPLEYGIGFELTPQYRHYFALHNWPAGASPTNKVPQFSYKNLVVTGMVELDQKQHVTVDLPGATGLGREKVISLRGAEYWRVIQGTVVDLDGQGQPRRVHADNLVLRDDIEKLRAVAAWAQLWYSQVRQAATIPVRDLIYSGAPQVGMLITEIVGVAVDVPVGTVVTSIRWDFRNQVRYTETGHAADDFDFEAMANEAAAMEAPAEMQRQVAAVPAIRRLEQSFANIVAREIPQASSAGNRRQWRRGILLEDLDEGSFALVQPICRSLADSGSSSGPEDDTSIDCCGSSTPDRVWEVFGCASVGDMIGYTLNEDVPDEVDLTCGRYEGTNKKCRPCAEPTGGGGYSSDGGGTADCADSQCEWVGIASDPGQPNPFVWPDQPQTSCPNGCYCAPPDRLPEFPGDVEFVDCAATSPSPAPPTPTVGTGGGPADTSGGGGAVFTLLGTGLVGPVTLTLAGSDAAAFELSADALHYFPSLTIDPAPLDRIEQTISVRLCGSSTAAHAAEVDVSSPGAAPVTQAVVFTPTPALTADVSSLDVFAGAQTFTLTASGLTGNVALTLSGTNPTRFELSTDGVSYASTLTLTPSGGIVSQLVYVRKTAPASAVDLSAVIQCASAGAATASINVVYDTP